jgi:NAD(P)-dependent dehydrogenase (short-subunit alcohol dehydrogenase family)
MRLKDKVVIVTGGARGIGREYCLGVAAEGARVVVAVIADPKPTAG